MSSMFTTRELKKAAVAVEVAQSREKAAATLHGTDDMGCDATTSEPYFGTRDNQTGDGSAGNKNTLSRAVSFRENDLTKGKRASALPAQETSDEDALVTVLCRYFLPALETRRRREITVMNALTSVVGKRPRKKWSEKQAELYGVPARSGGSGGANGTANLEIVDAVGLDIDNEVPKELWQVGVKGGLEAAQLLQTEALLRELCTLPMVRLISANHGWMSRGFGKFASQRRITRGDFSRIAESAPVCFASLEQTLGGGSKKDFRRLHHIFNVANKGHAPDTLPDSAWYVWVVAGAGAKRGTWGGGV